MRAPLRGTCARVVLGALSLSACVPADEALGHGSVEFTFEASTRTLGGVEATADSPPWTIRFDRTVLGFKTMTIGKIGVTDTCSYRGRGQRADVVIDPRVGVVQSFNGIQPVECPDVGVIFGSPSNTTTLGDGVAYGDLVELATGSPAHAIVEATATPDGESNSDPFGQPRPAPRSLRIVLRFDSERTSSRFGGCRAQARGVRILERQRDAVSVRFAAEHLFRDAISATANLRVRAFERADVEWGDNDGVVTMEELDETPLSILRDGAYQMPDGTSGGSLGDFVRFQFRFTVMFRTEDGLCIGNEPGAGEADGAEP